MPLERVPQLINTGSSATQDVVPPCASHKKPCVVAGCAELIHGTSTMWKHHMDLNAQGLFPGTIPVNWLEEQDLFICCH